MDVANAWRPPVAIIAYLECCFKTVSCAASDGVGGFLIVLFLRHRLHLLPEQYYDKENT